MIQQELYHRQALEALGRLGSYYESCKDYHQACIYAQKEIELEPWRESAHRRRMRALALGGERSQALRQYESCRTILKGEMGIEPSRETTDLFESIRAGDALITYEQNAWFARERGIPFEVIMPQRTILAKHYAVVIDKNVSSAERPVVEALLAFILSDEG